MLADDVYEYIDGNHNKGYENTKVLTLDNGYLTADRLSSQYENSTKDVMDRSTLPLPSIPASKSEGKSGSTLANTKAKSVPGKNTVGKSGPTAKGKRGPDVKAERKTSNQSNAIMTETGSAKGGRRRAKQNSYQNAPKKKGGNVAKDKNTDYEKPQPTANEEKRGYETLRKVEPKSPPNSDPESSEAKPRSMKGRRTCACCISFFVGLVIVVAAVVVAVIAVVGLEGSDNNANSTATTLAPLTSTMNL